MTGYPFALLRELGREGYAAFKQARGQVKKDAPPVHRRKDMPVWRQSIELAPGEVQDITPGRLR